ncbi:MAG: DsbA family protein [Lacisediminihabitans sp.]
MVTPGSNAGGQGNGQGKKDRREVARETARLAREAERKRKRRSRWLLQGGLGAGLLAVAAIVTLIVVGTSRGSVSQSTAGPLNMLSDGILLSGQNLTAVPTAAIQPGKNPVATDAAKYTKTVDIVIYADYQCPYCDQFEKTNSQQIRGLVASGLATVEFHPIAILDNSSQGTKYASRAANAAACVANYAPDTFYAVNAALYANQPAEGSSGLADQKLISILNGAGATSGKISSCVTSQEFVPWVTAATTRATVGPLPNTTLPKVTGTPTVLVDGAQYSGSLADASAFAAFVAKAVGTSR